MISVFAWDRSPKALRIALTTLNRRLNVGMTTDNSVNTKHPPREP
jgi:hypothetical protein